MSLPRETSALPFNQIFGARLSAKEFAHLIGNPLGLHRERQMSTALQLHAFRLPDTATKSVETFLGDEQVALPRQDQSGHANSVQPLVEVELLRQLEAMRNHALIGLPALPGD